MHAAWTLPHRELVPADPLACAFTERSQKGNRGETAR